MTTFSKNEERFVRALYAHLKALDRWTTDLNRCYPGGKLVMDEWYDAAEQAYKDAGGIDAFRVALEQQCLMDPEGESESSDMVRRVATARYIREGGLDAQMASVKAFCAVAAREASLPRNRGWRSSRKECNRKLLAAMRAHAALCAEISWADALDMTWLAYNKALESGKWWPPDVQYARSEFATCLGNLEAMNEISKDLEIRHGWKPTRQRITPKEV